MQPDSSFLLTASNVHHKPGGLLKWKKQLMKAFAATHKSDEHHQTYISASQRALSVIAKAKAET